ncbi:MAG: chloramphenicol acetyltransferase [Oligoflexales bacterium]|nr:chloramphenicol acetyltransferase [Oligoflexales bacterium]
MRYIDIEHWNRREHFKRFYNMDFPHYNICSNVKIGKFYRYLKDNDLSFTVSMVFLASMAANGIEEFRSRIRDGRVVVHESVDPSFTVLTDDQTFTFCTLPYNSSFLEFHEAGRTRIEFFKTNPNVEDEPGRDDFLFMTGLPWISFTGNTHPIHFRRDDSIPRIAWGKMIEEYGDLKLPFSVQVNHALIDGFHLGKYFEKVQEILDSPSDFLPLA